MTMISGGVEISIAGGGGEMVCVLSLGRFFFLFFFFFFFFFFVIMRSLFFRYKKPHVALAMERTKPVNQKHKQRKVTAPVSIHYRAGFSSAGPLATYNKESTTHNSVAW